MTLGLLHPNLPEEAERCRAGVAFRLCYNLVLPDGAIV
jgi:hypothetical protein